MTAATEETLTGWAWRALDGVVAPELDQPITELGFVHELSVAGTDVHVRLRLPTGIGAPTFAHMMVADVHDAIAGVSSVGAVDVQLEDHVAPDEINAGVADGEEDTA